MWKNNKRKIFIDINDTDRGSLLIISGLSINTETNICYFPILLGTIDEDENKEYYDFGFRLFQNGTFDLEHDLQFTNIEEIDNLEQVTDKVEEEVQPDLVFLLEETLKKINS